MLLIKILKSTLFIFLPVLLFIYLLIYSYLYITAVRDMVKSVNSLAEKEVLEKRVKKSYSAEEVELLKEKAALNARLKMAESDSIGLTVNVKDSLVKLELKGVTLREVKFDEFRYDRFFNAIHPEGYQVLFSKPFMIQRIEGASEKEPITYKKAPKDTIEAANMPGPEKIDSTKVEFIEWHMLLNNNIVVSVVQSESEKGKWSRENRRYRLRRYYSVLKANTINVFRLKMFDYHPEITIYIPAGEAKSFYRALPEKGDICLLL